MGTKKSNKIKSERNEHDEKEDLKPIHFRKREMKE